MATIHELDKGSFGRFLAQLRRERGLTQRDLAEMLFISDKAVSKWERGLSLPDVSLPLPLAEKLGVSVTELLGGPPDAGRSGSLQQNRSGCAHSKGVDVPDRTTRTPERAGDRNICPCISSAACWAL